MLQRERGRDDIVGAFRLAVELMSAQSYTQFIININLFYSCAKESHSTTLCCYFRYQLFMSIHHTVTSRFSSQHLPVHSIGFARQRDVTIRRPKRKQEFTEIASRVASSKHCVCAQPATMITEPKPPTHTNLICVCDGIYSHALAVDVLNLFRCR